MWPQVRSVPDVNEPGVVFAKKLVKDNIFWLSHAKVFSKIVCTVFYPLLFLWNLKVKAKKQYKRFLRITCHMHHQKLSIISENNVFKEFKISKIVKHIIFAGW